MASISWPTSIASSLCTIAADATSSWPCSASSRCSTSRYASSRSASACAEFAAALLHDPSILFLDEPTIGLDAPSKLAVRDFVRRLNREQGVTVLLTTHDMHDVEALAERVIVIGQGRLLADGPFKSLRAGVLAERRLYIDFAGPAPELEIKGVTVRARGERSLELAFDPAKIPTPKLIAAITALHAVDDIHVEEPAIEEVIARFYDLHDASEA